MPSKILELRRKVSGSFNNEDSLSYVRTNWSGIDGKPSVYPPAGHTHTISQITGLQIGLNAKQNTITGGASSITSDDLIINRALISDSAGKVITSAITATELGRLSGVESSIQTQLNGKAASSHTHTVANITGLSIALNAKADSSHEHAISDVTGLQSALNGKAASSHTHTIANITDLQTTLNGKAASSHNHTIAQVTGLQGALDDKAPLVHVQGWDTISGKPSFATVATSGSYADLSNKPTIPSIPSVMSASEGNLGTATTQRTLNAANLKSIILNHSPAGARPASDVSSWAKAGSKPSYNLDEISNGTTYKLVTQSEKDTWSGKQNSLGYTAENVTNKRTSIRTSGANNTSYVSELGVKTYVDGVNSNIQTQINGLAKINGNVGSEEYIYLGTTSSANFVDVHLGKMISGGYAMHISPEQDLTELYLHLGLYEGASVADNKIFGDTSVVNKKYVDTLKIVTSPSTTLNMNHRGCMIQPNTAGATTYTIPLNSSVPYPIGTRIQFLRRYAGAVNITRASSTITINGGTSVSISDQYKMIEIFKIDTNAWIAIGALS